MRTEIIVIAGIAVIGLVLWYNTRQQPVPVIGYAPVLTKRQNQAVLNTAGTNAAISVGGAIVDRIIDALNPSSSGVWGPTETNYPTGYTTSSAS